MAEGYGLRARRKRPAPTGHQEASALEQLLDLAETSRKIVVFTGSGLSANSGMSMFSTKGGLYERARKKFKISDGIKLFSYPFYKQRRVDVQAFFAQIYSEAQSSRAAQGHHALAELWRMGVLQRHYTLNIDGLAEVVGMDTWHHEHNPTGVTVEMHGNIRDMVCPECHAVEPLSRPIINAMKQRQPVPCTKCNEGEMRFKVMLYDDEEGDCITPEDIWESLEEDLAHADMVIWVGISFEQSASTEYFRKVRYFLSSMGRLDACQQVLINPSDEALFNLLSSCANRGDVNVLEVNGTSDEVLTEMAARLRKLHGHKLAAAEVAPAQAAEARAGELGRNTTGAEEVERVATGRVGLSWMEPSPTPPISSGRPSPEEVPGAGNGVQAQQVEVAAVLQTPEQQQQQQKGLAGDYGGGGQQQQQHGLIDGIKHEEAQQQQQQHEHNSGEQQRVMSRTTSMERVSSSQALNKQQLRLQQMEEWHKSRDLDIKADDNVDDGQGDGQELDEEERRRRSKERRQAAQQLRRQHEREQQEQQQEEQEQQQQHKLALAAALLAGSGGGALGLGLSQPAPQASLLGGILPGLALQAQLHAQLQVQQHQQLASGLMLPPLGGLALQPPQSALAFAAALAAAAAASSAPPLSLPLGGLPVGSAAAASSMLLGAGQLNCVQQLPQLPLGSASLGAGALLPPASAVAGAQEQQLSAVLAMLQQQQQATQQQAALESASALLAGAAGATPLTADGTSTACLLAQQLHQHLLQQAAQFNGAHST